jgi:hypothetical protein
MRPLFAVIALLLAIVLPGTGHASFSAVVGPPRFELRASPGAIVRESIDIATDSLETSDFAIRSADWEMAADGSVVFGEGDPAQGSCRPWLRLERREVRLAPRFQRKFRFEVHVPADAPTGECRFAILIEGKEPTASGPENIRFPLQGRIAVIVYVAVGDARPKLEFRSLQVATFNGREVPSITLANEGNAHGRPEGAIEARDANGRSLEFSVSSSPVLPGKVRTLPIWPNAGADGRTPDFAFPLRLRGVVEWQGGSYTVDTVVRP